MINIHTELTLTSLVANTLPKNTTILPGSPADYQLNKVFEELPITQSA